MGERQSRRCGRRAVWLTMAMMLAVALVSAQEIGLRIPKVAIPPADARLDGEAIGRGALLRVERQLAQERFDEDEAKHGGSSGADILSDTRGVDFKPYLREVLRAIYGRWLPLIPAEARPPQMASGTTWIRVRIDPEGKIIAMFLDGSSHDDALNRAAWGAIAGGGPLRRLPAEFTGPFLELRVRFLVNKGKTATLPAAPVDVP